MQDIMEQVLMLRILLQVMCESECAKAVAISGDSQRLRYLAKYQRIATSWVRDALFVRHEDRELEHVPTGDNVGDVFTKALGKVKHDFFVKALGLEDREAFLHRI